MQYKPISGLTLGMEGLFDVHFHCFKFFPFPLPAKERRSSIFYQPCLAFAEPRNVWRYEVLGGNAISSSARFFCDARGRTMFAFRGRNTADGDGTALHLRRRGIGFW